MSKTLLILGAGGHGRSLAEAALASKQWADVVFLDDNWPNLKEVMGYPVLGKVTEIAVKALHCDGAIAAVGNNVVREQWITFINHSHIKLVSIVHPFTWVSPSAEIDAGSAVMAGAVIGAHAVLGKGVIVNAGAVVDHDAKLDDLVHLGVGVKLAGGVIVGRLAWLQAGCCAGYNVTVPEAEVYTPGTILGI